MNKKIILACAIMGILANVNAEDGDALKTEDTMLERKLMHIYLRGRLEKSIDVYTDKISPDNPQVLEFLEEHAIIPPTPKEIDEIKLGLEVWRALRETQTHRDNANSASEMAKTALTETQTHRDNAKGALDVTTQHRDNAKTALTEIQTHRNNVYDALTKLKGHQNSADSIVKRLKREASLTDGEVTQDSDGTMYIGKEMKGSQIFVSGKQGDRVISGVASGARNSDAVNVSQLNTVRTTANYASQLAQKNSSRINHLEDRLSKTNTKIERGLATSAALTGLFQPYGVGKVNFTASIGGYGTSQALAVGTGYRITENAAVKAGVAYSGGNHVMYNASFNFEW